MSIKEQISCTNYPRVDVYDLRKISEREKNVGVGGRGGGD